MLTKDQQREWGTWWDQPSEPPQSVIDARLAHGLNADGSENTTAEPAAEPAPVEPTVLEPAKRAGRRVRR